MLEAVAGNLPEAFREAPIACGLVLGSGWGDVLRPEALHARLPYAALEGFGASTVAGHHGELLLMTLGGKRVAAFSGRRHYYEGCDLGQVVYPVELLRCLGVPAVLLTNAAGGLNPGFAPGTLMAVEDHLNLTGVNPLRGPHRPEWGPRFPDLSRVYDPALTDLLVRSGEDVRRGVYAFSVGPSYETPAEVRALRALGGDAVGMSTVPEAVVAHAAGLRVAALSCVTNPAAGLGAEPLSHAEVLAASEAAKPRMAALVAAFLRGLP